MNSLGNITPLQGVNSMEKLPPLQGMNSLGNITPLLGVNSLGNITPLQGVNSLACQNPCQGMNSLATIWAVPMALCSPHRANFLIPPSGYIRIRSSKSNHTLCSMLYATCSLPMLFYFMKVRIFCANISNSNYCHQ
jgi:hypothetical protein